MEIGMNEKDKNVKELNSAQKYFFGVGDLAFGWMTNIETYYYTYFLTNVAQFPLALVTIISTIGSLVDAALCWVYGIILNKMKPMKWGRYRSALIVFPWTVPLLYMLMFRAFNNGVTGAILIVLGCISSHILWNFPYCANMAMINVAAKNADQRNTLSATRGMWTYIGRCLYAYVGPGVLTFFTAKIGLENAYGATAFAFAALMAVGYFTHFVMFKGYEETGAEEMARLAQEKKKAEGKKVGIIQALASNPQILGVLGSYLFYMMNSFCYSAFAVYYANYIALDAGFITTYLFISNLAAVIGSVVSKRVANRLSTKTTYQLAMVIIAVMYMLAYVFRYTPNLVIVFTSIAGFFTAFVTIMVIPMLANCAIYSEYKTGVNVTGTVMGFLNIPIKVAILGRSFLITTVLAITGFDASIAVEAATGSVKNGIAMGFTLIPAILIVVGLVIVTVGYRIKDQDIAQYAAEIRSRKQA